MSFATFLLDHESALRLGFVLGMFVLMAVWDLFGRRRMLGISKAIPEMVTRLSALSTLAFFALFHPLLAVAQQVQQPTGPQQQPWNWPGPWHMWSGGWAFWWICPLIVLFIIVVCVAIFLLGRRSGDGGPHHWGPSWHTIEQPWGPGRLWGDPTYSALQVLNERFARGEIQKEEYEQKKVGILSNRQR